MILLLSCLSSLNRQAEAALHRDTRALAKTQSHLLPARESDVSAGSFYFQLGAARLMQVAISPRLSAKIVTKGGSIESAGWVSYVTAAAVSGTLETLLSTP